MLIRLKYGISANALPSDLTVTDFKGNLIFSTTLYLPYGEVDFCSVNGDIVIRSNPRGSELTDSVRYVRLPCRRQYFLTFYFDFTSFEPSLPFLFTLKDANYYFPIKSAKLNFCSAL